MGAMPEFRRDVLVSVRPTYAGKILTGQKTVELRRRFPESGLVGATVLIYSSSPVCAIIASARIRHVLKLPLSKIWKQHGVAACISRVEFDSYFAGLKLGFAILFEDLRPLANQLSATELAEQFGIVPPQSYRYVTRECIAFVSDDRFQTSNRYKRGHRVGRPAARSIVSR